jgi:CRISPR/Cas system-associated exonuclease Cas4 (RecB family)
MTSIERDPYYEEFFQAELGRDVSFRGGPRLHRSDLIYCLRKAYFRLMGIEPPEHFTMEFTIIGKTLHRIIERSFKYNEIEMEKDGISGTVDVVVPFGDKKLPIEIKTTRRFIANANDIPSSYIEQLKIAIIMAETNEGLLAILNIITAKIQVWVLRMTDEEKNGFWQEILSRRALVEKAVAEKNFLLLPRTLWLCKNCEYRTICDAAEPKN